MKRPIVRLLKTGCVGKNQASRAKPKLISSFSPSIVEHSHIFYEIRTAIMSWNVPLYCYFGLFSLCL